MANTSFLKSSRFWQILTLALGVTVLLAVFFADKTLLSNQVQVVMADPAQAGESGQQASSSTTISPLASDPQTESLLADLASASDVQEKARILNELVVNLQARNRPDHAVQYASQLVDLDRSFPHLIQAGKLAYEATQLEYVHQDTVLTRNFARQAIQWLEEVSSKDARQEEALLYQGLSYVAMGMPEYSMQGILTIRKVLETNPDNALAGYQLGLFSIQTGQFDKAVQRLEKVLSLQPDNQRARLALAEAQQGLGNKQAAETLLRQVIDQAKDPDLKQAAQTLLNQ